MHESMVLEVFQFAPHVSATNSVGRRSELIERVEEALRCTPQLCGCAVSCEQEEDTVILRGQLPSYYLKQVAQIIAGNVDGVERVVNEVEVDPHRARAF